MLEPQAEDPRLLLEHHRRQAKLNAEAGDRKAAYWHGRKAQAVFRRIREEEQEGALGACDACGGGDCRFCGLHTCGPCSCVGAMMLGDSELVDSNVVLECIGSEKGRF